MQTTPDRFDYDQNALEDIAARLDLRLVVLFGSFARGSPPPGPDSDIDIALAFRRGVSTPRFWDVHEALGPVFPRHPLDVAYLADADPLFRWEIMEHSVLLHGDVLDFLELRAFAFRDFVDSADLRALERTLFEKKMAYIRRRLHGAA